MPLVAFVTTLICDDSNVEFPASGKSKWNYYPAFVVLTAVFDISSITIKPNRNSSQKIASRTIRVLLQPLLFRVSSSVSPFPIVAMAVDSESSYLRSAPNKLFRTRFERRYSHSITYSAKVEKFEPPIVGHTSLRIYTSLCVEETCGRHNGKTEIEKDNERRYHDVNHEYRIQILEVPHKSATSLNANVAQHNDNMFAYPPFSHWETILLDRSHLDGFSDIGNLKRPHPILNVVKVPRRKCSDAFGAAASHETCRQILLVKIWRVHLDHKGSMVRRVVVGSEVQVVNYLDQSPVPFHFRLKQDTEAKSCGAFTSHKVQSITDQDELDLSFGANIRFSSPLIHSENSTLSDDMLLTEGDREYATKTDVQAHSPISLGMPYSDHGKHYDYYADLFGPIYSFIAVGIIFVCCIRFRYAKIEELLCAIDAKCCIIFEKFMKRDNLDEHDSRNNNYHQDSIIVSPDVMKTNAPPQSPRRARVIDKKMISFDGHQTSRTNGEGLRYFHNLKQFMRRESMEEIEAFEGKTHSACNERDFKYTNCELIHSPPAIQRVGNRFDFNPSDKYPYSLFGYHLSVHPNINFQEDEKNNLLPYCSLGDEIVHGSSDAMYRNSKASVESPKSKVGCSSYNGSLSICQVETSLCEQKSVQASTSHNFVLYDATEQHESKDQKAEIQAIDMECDTMPHQCTIFEDVDEKDKESVKKRTNPSDFSLKDGPCVTNELIDLPANITNSNNFSSALASNLSSKEHVEMTTFQTPATSEFMENSPSHSKSDASQWGRKSIRSEDTTKSNYATGCVLHVYSDLKQNLRRGDDFVENSPLSRKLKDKERNKSDSIHYHAKKCVKEYVPSETRSGQKRKFGVLENVHNQPSPKKRIIFDEDKKTVHEDSEDIDEGVSLEANSKIDDKTILASYEVEQNCQLSPKHHFDTFRELNQESMILSSGDQPKVKSDQHITGQNLIELGKAITFDRGHSANSQHSIQCKDNESPDHGSNKDLEKDNSTDSGNDTCATERIQSRMGLHVHKSVNLLAFSRLFQAPVWEFCESTVSSLDCKDRIVDKTANCKKRRSNPRAAKTSKRDCSKDTTSTSKRFYAKNKKRKRNAPGTFHSIPTEIFVHKHGQDSALVAFSHVMEELNTTKTTEIKGASDNSENSPLTRNASSTMSSKRSRAY